MKHETQLDEIMADDKFSIKTSIITVFVFLMPVWSPVLAVFLVDKLKVSGGHEGVAVYFLLTVLFGFSPVAKIESMGGAKKVFCFSSMYLFLSQLCFLLAGQHLGS